MLRPTIRRVIPSKRIGHMGVIDGFEAIRLIHGRQGDIDFRVTVR